MKPFLKWAGMNQRLHYKEIYQLAKERVNAYAETVKLLRLEGVK